MEGLVSIIMPSFNTANYIKESIDSVLAQTYSNWELIIVDDCSTDNTEEVVAEYKDERIKFYKNPVNSGAALTRNYALREAKGKWVAFLDSDDLWEKDKLEKQIRFMTVNGYKASYTKYERMNQEGNSLNELVSGPKKVGKTGIYNYCWMGCLTVMYDAEYVGLIQIEKIAKNNDYAMWLKMCKKTPCYLLNENLARYRAGRSGSISTTNYSALIKWHYRLFRICDKRNPISAWFLTCRNLFFGIIKKMRYEKRK